MAIPKHFKIGAIVGACGGDVPVLVFDVIDGERVQAVWLRSAPSWSSYDKWSRPIVGTNFNQDTYLWEGQLTEDEERFCTYWLLTQGKGVT